MQNASCEMKKITNCLVRNMVNIKGGQSDTEKVERFSCCGLRFGFKVSCF